MADELKKLVKKSKSKLGKMADQSKKWFKKSIEKAFKSKVKSHGDSWITSQLIGSDKELRQAITTMGAPAIGHLYFYAYDPKWKKELPYYDTFPLVIPIDYMKGGFLGVNFHYLPPLMRATLLDELLKFKHKVPATAWGQREFLKLSYDLLKGVKTSVYKPTIKRYLFSHLRSRLAQVDFSEWENAVFLPVENFQKASKREVWAKSREYL